jgi:hypothetical protein
LVAEAAMSGRFKPNRKPREAKEFRRVALDEIVRRHNSKSDGAGQADADASMATPARFGRRGIERRRGERRV